MTKYTPQQQKKLPKFYCNKCGSLCCIGKALEDFDSGTGEKNYKYWLKCPRYSFFNYGHQNEGAHLIDDSWHFSSGWY